MSTPIDDLIPPEPADELNRLRFENQLLRRQKSLTDPAAVAQQLARADALLNRAKWTNYGALAYCLLGAVLFLAHYFFDCE